MLGRLLGVGAAAAISAVVLFGTTSPAEAKYEYCNNTSYVLKSAIAYYADGQWTSRGWWTLHPGQCRTVLPQDLRHGTYYTYAESVPGHVGGIKYFAGDEAFCTGEGYFTLYGRDCETENAREGRFVRVDVGSERNWTTTFSESQEFNTERAEIAGVQRLLADNGYDPGNIDGELGKKTRDAIADFKATQGLAVAELISEELISSLAEAANTKAQQKGYNFCNRTGDELWTAIAYDTTGEGDMRSKGWWLLAPGECSKVIKDELTEDAYYVYAVMDGDGGELEVSSGEHSFCIADSKFDIEGGADCDLRGFDSAGFVKIETGGATSWTQSFRYSDTAARN